MILALTGALEVFAVEMSFKTNKSVIATPRSFRTDFMLRQNDSVPDRISNPQQYQFSIRNKIMST